VIAIACGSRLEARQSTIVPSKPPLETRTLSRVECGIYALAAAAISLGIKFELGSLVDAKYVLPARGSSMSQLSRAARDCGFWAYPMRNVGADYLIRADRPLLLNLTRSDKSKCPGHWVTFLGDLDGKALMYDLARTPRLSLSSYGDLLQQMSGDAMMVSKTKSGLVEQTGQTFSSLLRYWPLLPLVIIGVFFRRQKETPISLEMGILLVIAIIWALLTANGVSGFNSNRGAVAWIQAKTLQSHQHDTVAVDQLNALRKRNDVVIVDARTRWQFDLEHIPGAVYLGVDLDCEQFANGFEKYRDRKMFIVYCSNSQCGWADLIAGRLMSFDARNVRVFAGGIEEWNNHLPALKR
jgi:rhodanese-related sulfurtransferase